MTTFIVTATSITYHTLEVEAENEADALDQGRYADDGDFDQDNEGDWQIIEVRKVSND